MINHEIESYLESFCMNFLNSLCFFMKKCNFSKIIQSTLIKGVVWMKKSLILGIAFVFLLSACSASDHNDKRSFEMSSNDMAVEHESAGYEGEQTEATEDRSDEAIAERKIIHRANLQLRVSDFGLAQSNIEGKVAKYEGYIVESTVYHDENELSNGYMIIRIPAKNFQGFLADTEKEATNVIERNVTGEDVTEQYVDLEARLTSKRVVEERLLNFLKEAEKTEDLLRISADLSVVQEEIESLVGKINYLENQTEYSTVEIGLIEARVILPEVGTKGFDTWEKTKKQFFTSINFLLAFGSGLIVFILGNFPVLFILLGVGVGVYFLVRRKLKRTKQKLPNQQDPQ